MTLDSAPESPGLAHYAQLEPDRMAITEPQGRQWTRIELFEHSNRLTRALRRRGVAPADAIAVLAPNCPEYLGAYFAAMQMGAFFVPINWHLSPREIAHILREARPAAILLDIRVAERFQEAVLLSQHAIRLCLSIQPCDGFIELGALIRAESGAPLAEVTTGRVLVFTSATTGLPKGVRRPLQDARQARYRHLQLMAELFSQAGVELGNGTHLCQSMLYHTVPLSHAATALNLGQHVVLMTRWHAELALHQIERYQVATTFMVPSMFVQLLKLSEETRARYVTRSLRFVSHGGASTPVDIKRRMIDWWGDCIHELYGASEGIATGVTAEEWLRRPGTVGRAHPGVDIIILDEAGNELPPEVPGSIYIRSAAHERFEYINDPDKTAKAYRGDYFTVGDVGYLTQDGYLFICDRREDLIIRGGINIYPAEIESVLVQHPAVADCAVLGCPDVDFGEYVVAAVSLVPGEKGDPQMTLRLLQFLVGKLAPEKLPTRFEYIDALPRDPAGKMYKRHLRELLARDDL